MTQPTEPVNLRKAVAGDIDAIQEGGLVELDGVFYRVAGTEQLPDDGDGKQTHFTLEGPEHIPGLDRLIAEDLARSIEYFTSKP